MKRQIIISCKEDLKSCIQEFIVFFTKLFLLLNKFYKIVNLKKLFMAIFYTQRNVLILNRCNLYYEVRSVIVIEA